MNINDTATVFKALADTNRLQILKLIADKKLCACEILEAFKFTQPALSQHMKILMSAELVEGEKRGNWVFYTLNNKKYPKILELIMSISDD